MPLWEWKKQVFSASQAVKSVDFSWKKSEWWGRRLKVWFHREFERKKEEATSVLLLLTLETPQSGACLYRLFLLQFDGCGKEEENARKQLPEKKCVHKETDSRVLERLRKLQIKTPESSLRKEEIRKPTIKQREVDNTKLNKIKNLFDL